MRADVVAWERGVRRASEASEDSALSGKNARTNAAIDAARAALNASVCVC
jgi:hypothetical protein